MTIAEYLQGRFSHQFTEGNILTALVSRGLDPKTPQQDVSEKDKDLARADLYEILANVVSGGGKKVTKGNRSVSERMVNFGVNDRRYYQSRAKQLRAKWGIRDDGGENVKFKRILDI